MKIDVQYENSIFYNKISNICMKKLFIKLKCHFYIVMCLYLLFKSSNKLETSQKNVLEIAIWIYD